MPFDPTLFIVLPSCFAVMWLQQRTSAQQISDLNQAHATEISDLKQAHATEISNLREIHKEEISRLVVAHDSAMTLQQTAARERVTAAYEAGLGAAHPHVYKGVKETKGFLKTTRRDVALAVVFSTDGRILGVAGDYGDLEAFRLSPELKKALTLFLGHGGGGAAGLVA